MICSGVSWGCTRRSRADGAGSQSPLHGDRCKTPQPSPPPSGELLLPWLLTGGHVCRRYQVSRDLSEQPGLCQRESSREGDLRVNRSVRYWSGCRGDSCDRPLCRSYLASNAIANAGDHKGRPYRSSEGLGTRLFKGLREAGTGNVLIQWMYQPEFCHIWRASP